jgi:hypothetical protein
LETCLDGCTTFSFIWCSYCTRFYCFKHFICSPHLHFDADHDDDLQHVIPMCNSDLRNCTDHFQ